MTAGTVAGATARALAARLAGYGYDVVLPAGRDPAVFQVTGLPGSPEVEGEEWVARSKDGLCTLSAVSLTAVEAKARQEKELWASVRAFAQDSRWRAADG